ncbi:MAG TPA: peptidylprolyl isomerase [Pirellulales bacterium]|nr:peptidylprolyl isomerase [Pirellulales bacterium]
MNLPDWRGGSGGKNHKKSAGSPKRKRNASFDRRRLALEHLEERWVLSGVTLSAISGPDGSGTYDIPAGKDLYVPLLGADATAGTTVTYSATVNSGNFTATVMPSSDPVLELNVSGTTTGGTAFSGALTISLFSNIAPDAVSNIVSLVEKGLYTNTSFYRTGTSAPFDFIQGGIQDTGQTDPNPNPIVNDFNANAAYNSPGMLAMAATGTGAAAADFFITAPDTALDTDPLAWNYQYAIFGQLLSYTSSDGQNLYNDIANTASSTDLITITSAQILTNSQAGVLQISEPSTFTGGGSITVTATGSDGSTTSQTFNVDSVQPTVDNASTAEGTAGGPEVLAPVSNQTTSENTPTNAITLSATESFTGGLPAYSITGPFTAGSTTPFNDPPANLTVTPTSGSSTNNSFTLTPASDWVGDFDLVAHADDTNASSVHDALPFTLTVTGQADLDVTTVDTWGGSSVTPSTGAAVAGQPITYTVTVSNKGTTNVTGASLVDTLPTSVNGATYTITPSSGAADLDFGGSETTTGGVTTISDSNLSLAAGSTVTFVIKGTVSSGATGSTITSTAVVAPPSGVTLTGGNTSATDSDSVVAAPVVTPSGSTNTYMVGGTAVPVDSGVTVNFSGADLTGATVTISSGTVQSDDALHFSTQNGITGVYSNGTLTLSGSATPAQYQTALQSVTFTTTSDSPTTRSLSIVALDNSATSNSAVESVKIIAPPVVTASGTTNTFTVGGTAVAVDSGLTVTSNDTDLTGATVTISSGTLKTGDTLNFTTQNGITGVYSNGTLTLNGSATPTQYQTALQSVTFSTTSNNTTTRAISVVALDNSLTSNTTAESVKVAITPPVVTPSGTVNTFTIDSAAVAVDSGVTVSSFDTDLTGASVTISTGTLQTGDALQFTNQNGITGVYSNGTLTLTGSATPAQYQAALQSVTFSTTNATSQVTRTLAIVATDNSLTSNSAAESVKVITAPIVTPSGSTSTFTIGGTAVAVDSGVTVSSNAADLTGATMTISPGTLQTGDSLNFTNQNGITGVYSDGTLTLTGSATPAQYQTALQSVTFSATGTNQTTRSISIVVADNSLVGQSAAESVKVSFNPPVVTPSGTTNTFTVGGSAAAVDSGVTVTATEDDLTGATVTISPGTVQLADTLHFTSQNGITGVYSDGTLTLSGTATPAQYQTALQSVTFATNSGSPTTRSIAIVAFYQTAASNSAAESIKVIAPPIVTASGTTNTFTLGGTAVAVDSGLTVSSNDTDLTGATMTISSGTLQTGDTLQFTNQNGISGSYSGGTLALTGNATPAQYQAALQSVTFSTTSTDTATRAISIVALDNSLSSNATAESVNVAIAAPVVTASGAVNTYTVGGTAVAVDSGITVSSFDTDLTGATMTISSGTLQTGDTLDFTNQNGITGSYSGGVLTLSGNATAAQYQTALQSVTFSTTNTTSTVTRSLTVVALDDSLTSNAAAESVKVISAPVVTASGQTNTFSVGGAAVAVDSGVTVSSNDTDLTGVTVTISSGTLQTGDTLNFTTQNGISGSYSAGVLTLSGSATVANYQTALQSVTFSTTSTNTTARSISIVALDNSLTSTAAAETVDVTAATATLSGTVFDDAKQDGTLGSGDATLANVTITLTGTDSNGNSVNQTTQTGSNGTYSFSNLVAGTYTLTASIPSDLTFDDAVVPTGDSGTLTAGAQTITQIAVTAGASDTGYDFTASGFTPAFILANPSFFSINLISTSYLGSSPATTMANIVNEPPTITGALTSLGAQTVDSGSSTPVTSFTISDPLVPASSLTVTPTSSNTTVVPDANIKITGNGANQTIAVTPATNEPGTATITTTVADPYGNQTLVSFTVTENSTVTVTPSGTPGTFTIGGSAMAVDSGVKVTSDATDLTGATVTVSSGTLQSTDMLNFVTQNGITGNYTAGTLTLSGSATPAQYQAALQSVTFSTTSTSSTTRSLSIVVSDGSFDSSSAAESVAINPTGTPAVVTGSVSPAAVDAALSSEDDWTT